MPSAAGNVIAEQRNTQFKTYAEVELDFQDELDAELKRVHDLEMKFIVERAKYKEKLETQRAVREKELQISVDKERFRLQQQLDDTLDKLRKKGVKNLTEQEKKLREDYEKKISKFTKAEQKKQRQEEFQERLKQQEELANTYGLSLRERLKENQKLVKESLDISSMKAQLNDAFKAAGSQILSNLGTVGTQAVNDAINTYSGVYSTINARLQGSDKNAKGIFDLMNRNLAISPFVKYEDMLQNTAEIVSQGISYNVEERAFLMSIKDKIAATFEVANGTLLKIIRIQQEDSTRARLGMEASLTAFLNSNFQDTSYLNQVYDTVSDAVADSVVQLGTRGGTEYEYQMQKWLGSLYSIGLSSETVTGLASAINMLATGDVTGLQNSGMQNLLVMAANKSGMNYGDLLTQGVNASNLNALMSNVVSYWSQLAQNNNQVVRKKYAELFGLDMSDLVAIRNVDQSLLNTLVGKELSYTGMTSELNSQLGQVASRMHVSELLNNLYENAIGGIGRSIANSPGLMATWLINDFIKQATGGINIPSVSTMFAGLDLETDLNSLAQLGMVGIGTLGQIGNIIMGLGSNGGLNLNAWRSEDTTRRGTGLGAVVTGVTSSTSQTTFIGNASSSDIYSSSLNAAYDSVDTSVMSQEQEESKKMQDAITDHIDPNVQAILDLLRAVSNGTSIRVRVEDYGLTSPF